MGITTSFKEIQSLFNPQYWSSIDEFEEYYLRRIQETCADRNYYTDRNGVEREIDFINHHPELKEYEVWSEGFSITGQEGNALLLGKAFARNFQQACDIVMCKSHLQFIEEVNKPDCTEYCPPRTWDYNPRQLTDWVCALYWSKELAEKTFG